MIVKPLRPFSEFLSEGIVKKQFPDKERAKFITIEAEKKNFREEKIERAARNELLFKAAK